MSFMKLLLSKYSPHERIESIFCVRRKPVHFCHPTCTSTIGSVLILQYLLQTNAIKEFYEENEAEDQSGVNRLIWVTKKGMKKMKNKKCLQVTKKGMPATVFIFIIVYWVVGFVKYQSG